LAVGAKKYFEEKRRQQISGKKEGWQKKKSTPKEGKKSETGKVGYRNRRTLGREKAKKDNERRQEDILNGTKA